MCKNSIPRGRVKAYKCFWSEKLDEIKAKRDRLRRKAELSKRQSDMVLWRKQVALFKKTVLEAKRKCFNDFISNINYKEDSMKTYKFLSTLQNKRPVPKRSQFTSMGQF
ncbi:hypothetical protein CEXT_389361 [Caerostris extrusa]|uniref:Uncharacterized protein n=1 Tax=Caerostris extrusa TaxID=172846 RepID=A0AAV4PKI6_CAEEX|nr:hypothetical protein CEXT_389361 [Caerostris extrusa]